MNKHKIRLCHHIWVVTAETKTQIASLLGNNYIAFSIFWLIKIQDSARAVHMQYTGLSCLCESEAMWGQYWRDILQYLRLQTVHQCWQLQSYSDILMNNTCSNMFNNNFILCFILMNKGQNFCRITFSCWCCYGLLVEALMRSPAGSKTGPNVVIWHFDGIIKCFYE